MPYLNLAIDPASLALLLCVPLEVLVRLALFDLLDVHLPALPRVRVLHFVARVTATEKPSFPLQKRSFFRNKEYKS